jgi:putative hemolysin
MDRVDGRLLERVEPHAPRRRYMVSFARSAAEVRAAQALRWRVFSGELGARLPTRTPGIDHDLFDPHCEHLVVRDEACGEVIGTYRVLAPGRARRIGCYYAESEFDLTRLQLLREGLVEVGRSCVHPDYRAGTVISLLWGALAHYMRSNGYAYIAGCASMGVADGGHGAASVYRRIAASHLAPVEFRVFPRCALAMEGLDATRPVDLPPLLRGYLNCGAWVCGEPAWDPDFNTADFFVFLPMARMAARHARHYLRQEGVASV